MTRAELKNKIVACLKRDYTNCEDLKPSWIYSLYEYGHFEIRKELDGNRRAAVFSGLYDVIEDRIIYFDRRGFMKF